MNDQIKTLLERSGAHGPGGLSMDRYSFSEQDVENFVNLIVLECAKRAHVSSDPRERVDEYNRGWQNGRNHAAAIIKEHFGIVR